MKDDIQRQNFLFILTVLLIFPLPQIAIDLYLPSLPVMARYFHISDFYIQLTFTVYILFLGGSQLIYGPCSDKFGRKPILLIGTFLFLIGSIGCVLAGSIWQLLIFRAIQGIGMGCGFVVASAILGESFQGKKLAKMTTLSSTIYSLSPLLAPVLGGYLQEVGGWRANFLTMVVFCFILFLMILYNLKETNRHKNKDALVVKKMLADYLTALGNLKFIGYVTCAILGFGINVTFCVISPFLFQNVLHMSIMATGIMLFIAGLAYFIGTLANNGVLNFLNAQQAIMLGITLMIIFSLTLCLSGLIGWFTPVSIMLFTFFVIFGTGFIFANCFAKLLEMFPNNLGLISAIIGSSGLVGASIISAIVAHVPVYNATILGIIFFIESLFCLAAYFFTTVDKKTFIVPT